MKQVLEADKEYKDKKLIEKIKENGSLYAVPSTNEGSQHTEMQELLNNMAPIIDKPDKLFKDKEITNLYR